MMNPLYSCHCLTFHGLSATTQNGKWENDEQIDKKEDYLLYSLLLLLLLRVLLSTLTRLLLLLFCMFPAQTEIPQWLCPRTHRITAL